MRDRESVEETLFAFERSDDLADDDLRRERLRQYESILYSLKSGVVILEPLEAGRADTLQIAAVNRRGAEFFGQATGMRAETLDDAAY